MKDRQQSISIDVLLKRVMIQLKYEEIGSWLLTHNIPLFYSHDRGFTIVDKKYIENHPKLKKVLDETVKDVEEKNKKTTEKKIKSKTNSNYFG